MKAGTLLAIVMVAVVVAGVGVAIASDRAQNADPLGPTLETRRLAWVRRLTFLACVADDKGDQLGAQAFRTQAQLIHDGLLVVPPDPPQPWRDPIPKGCGSP